MKKILYSIMALAIAAMTFTSCEDVPEPYPSPTPSQGGTAIEGATGDGTLENPFNAIAATNVAKELGSGNVSEQMYYIKGKVVSIATDKNDNVLNFNQGTYGNASFYISDDGTSTNQFYCYRVLYLGNKKWTQGSGDILKVGDEVIVCAKITMYNTTPETQQNEGFLYSLNGKSEGGGDVTPGEAKGSGTLEDPFNAVAAVAYAKSVGDKESEKDVYIKGKVSSISEQYGTQYGNATFNISEDGTSGNEFTVFRALYLGNKKYSSGDLLEVGDEVIVCGKVTCYKGNTPETVQGKAFLYSLNGKTEGGETPTPVDTGDGNGSADSPYNVAGAVAAGTGTGVYVKAFIVGYVSGQVLASGAKFTADGCDVQSNVLIAASADETDVAKCMPVQLPNGAVRSGVNLMDNASNYKKEITLYGNIEKYFGTTGIKSVTYAMIDGKDIGTKPGDNPGTSGEIKAVSIAEFNAASESNDVWYKLTGTVKNLKDNDQYGNFDLEDSTGSVYVYGLLAEKGGEKKKFQELVAAKGIKNGSKITIIGVRGSYNGKIEVMNAYFVSIEDGEGGSDTPSTEGVKAVSVADFNAAAESNDVWYQLTGTVKNLKDNDQYGNFDLEDSTGSVYVYGLLSEKGGEKKKFQELVAAKGIKNGSTITIIGNRGSYKEKIEVMNAYFVSIGN